MKKLHISGKRKALGALLASLIIGVSSTAALAAEAGDLSVFDENDAELSILEESSLMRKQLAHMLQGKKNFKEANYGDTIQSADKAVDGTAHKFLTQTKGTTVSADSILDPWGAAYTYSQADRTVTCTPKDASGTAMTAVVRSF